MRMKKIMAAFLTGILLINSTTQVLANSAPAYWMGSEATEIVIMDEQCPIEVKSEKLTLDIKEFPQSYYETMEAYSGYSSSVTAEYELYNPTEETITARLYFPFGFEPDYLYWEGFKEKLVEKEAEKYQILINGETIEKTIRHSYSSYANRFYVENELKRIEDNQKKDEFFTPDLLVTRYVYNVLGVDPNLDEAYAKLKFEQDNTKIHTSGWVENGKIVQYVEGCNSFSIYAFGEPLKNPEEWEIYESEYGLKKAEGEITLVNQETMSFEELVLSKNSKGYNISDVDWYNAYVDMLNDSLKEYGYIEWLELDKNYNIMNWYEYEISIEPGETIVNQVTAPLYPHIDESYEPPVYEYEYYLTPAKMWASFENLEIQINTPYYLVKDNLQGFEKNENGYYKHLDELPNKDLKISMSTVEESELSEESNVVGFILWWIMVILMEYWWIFAIIIALIVFFKIKNKKGK